jgi:hypothetical protein
MSGAVHLWLAASEAERAARSLAAAFESKRSTGIDAANWADSAAAIIRIAEIEASHIPDREADEHLAAARACRSRADANAVEVAFGEFVADNALAAWQLAVDRLRDMGPK